MLLRDIIDLDSTYSGGPGEDKSATGGGMREEEPEVEEGAEGAEGEATVSLSAMEEELLHGVLETLDAIAGTYNRLGKLQSRKLDSLKGGDDFSRASERRHDKLHEDLVTLVKSVRLNNYRIEALVQQLYGYNKELMGLEGKLLRLGEKSRIKREEFLAQHIGHELEPKWLSRVSRLKGKGWADFAKRHGDEVKDIRGEITRISGEIGLPIGEFRRIVGQVQRGEREASRA